MYSIYWQTSHNSDTIYWEVTSYFKSIHDNKIWSTLKRIFLCTVEEGRRAKSAFGIVTLCHHLLAKLCSSMWYSIFYFFSPSINCILDSMGSPNSYNILKGIYFFGVVWLLWNMYPILSVYGVSFFDNAANSCFNISFFFSLTFYIIKASNEILAVAAVWFCVFFPCGVFFLSRQLWINLENLVHRCF